MEVNVEGMLFLFELVCIQPTNPMKPTQPNPMPRAGGLGWVFLFSLGLGHVQIQIDSFSNPSPDLTHI